MLKILNFSFFSRSAPRMIWIWLEHKKPSGGNGHSTWPFFHSVDALGRLSYGERGGAKDSCRGFRGGFEGYRRWWCFKVSKRGGVGNWSRGVKRGGVMLHWVERAGVERWSGWLKWSRGVMWSSAKGMKLRVAVDDWRGDKMDEGLMWSWVRGGCSKRWIGRMEW